MGAGCLTVRPHSSDPPAEERSSSLAAYIHMPSHGSTVRCPACDAGHLVQGGEINAHRQIEYLCLGCGGKVTMEHDGSGAVAAGTVRRTLLKLKKRPD